MLELWYLSGYLVFVAFEPQTRQLFEANSLLVLDVFIFNSSKVSELVTLHFDSKPTCVLCHFGDFGCGDGGWTPVMKIDGNMVRHFES